jgi:hypothetical protein
MSTSDTSRGTSPDLRYVEHQDSDLLSSARGRDEVAALQKVEWEIKTDFATESLVATEVHGRLEREIDEVMTDLKNGRNLDLGKLRDGCRGRWSTRSCAIPPPSPGSRR